MGCRCALLYKFMYELPEPASVINRNRKEFKRFQCLTPKQFLGKNAMKLFCKFIILKSIFWLLKKGNRNEISAMQSLFCYSNVDSFHTDVMIMWSAQSAMSMCFLFSFFMSVSPQRISSLIAVCISPFSIHSHIFHVQFIT